MHNEHRLRSTLLVAGTIAVAYGVLVLLYATTSPDLRMRVLLVDDDRPEIGGGTVIRDTTGIQVKGSQPVESDVLLKIGERRIRSFLDVTAAHADLRFAPVPPGGSVAKGADPSELAEAFSLPSLVKEKNGPRWVRVHFWSVGSQSEKVGWVAVQSLPLSEVGLTLIWFLMDLLILGVAGLAVWHRPFDRPARLFFAMSITTTIAFVGGFHWWVIAANVWLNVPFVISAVLLPVVVLHFFLVYPRPKPPLSLAPRTTLTVIYFVPLATTLVLLGGLGSAWQLSAVEDAVSAELQVLEWLNFIRAVIYSYLFVAAVYFLATIAALAVSFFSTRNPVEHAQVRWILWAGILATGFIFYVVALAYTNRVSFALGGARWPMLFASLVFLVAYAVGVVRYKLMLVDQIVSRGMMYYLTSSLMSIGFATIVAGTGLLPVYWNASPSSMQSAVLVVVLVLAVLLLIAFRDLLQRGIDRRFFREKYRLDRALQRMNRGIGELADIPGLGQQMLVSCKEVLQVRHASLYLRERRGLDFRLIGTVGDVPQQPTEITVPRSFIETVLVDPTRQRTNPDAREPLSDVQTVLRLTHGDLVHALRSEGDLVGMVVLGAKESQSPFTAEDVTFVTALGQTATVALHCARVHQNLSRLNQELQSKTERIAQQKRQIDLLQSELTAELGEPAAAGTDAFSRGQIRGESAAIRRVLETARKVASSESSVLIRGESGTGKELLARMLHDNSPRREGPLVVVHCAALAQGLLESELFGHVKGAFTGAQQDRIGRFEQADGGTLFLDEVGDVPLETQVKLLRVLQQRTFEPVGSSESRRTNVRVVAATHRRLEAMIESGAFREDLYYRLNVITIALPALRERDEDIAELAMYFVRETARRQGKRISGFTDEAFDVLQAYHWPGNVRELENVIERAVVLAEETTIDVTDLPAELFGGVVRRQAMRDVPSRDVPLRNEEVTVGEREERWNPDHSVRGEAAERKQLHEALIASGGNKTKAARLLGLPRSTYYSRLKKLGLG